MADRFIVVGTNDPRVPEDERYEDDMYRSVLLDTRDKRILGTDGGEPEDQSFGRSWSWVPDELNALAARIDALAARIDALTEQLRRVIAGCEVALLEPDRTRSILRDMHSACAHVYNGGAPDAPTGEQHGD